MRQASTATPGRARTIHPRAFTLRINRRHQYLVIQQRLRRFRSIHCRRVRGRIAKPHHHTPRVFTPTYLVTTRKALVRRALAIRYLPFRR